MKLKILFLLYKSKANSTGRCPVRCRITSNKRRKEFSTGLFINPDYWNSKKQKVEPCEDSTYINQQLSLVKNNLYQAFLFLQVSGESFTVEDIYSRYKGEPTTNEKQVLETYREYLTRIEKLIGKDLQLVTYKKYQESYRHLADFIKWKYKRKDVQLKSLKGVFLDDYSYFLKVEKSLAQSTLNKAIQRFRKVVKYAVAQDYLNKDPFLLYKPRTSKKEVVFLSRKELTILEEKEFALERLERIRDMFVFCCYTGLGFKEMANLKKEDVYVEFDDKPWIHVKRQKNNRTYKIPILTKARKIMVKYDGESREMVLPSISNTHFNAYLKEIASLCGIKKRLTHHIARKTFATTILLYNDVPMEIVSKLLGHSKLQTTQDHYGKVIQKRISEEITRISGKFK
ncbi:site-specific integrase [Altibacter sp. HG106]|uniref:site-specific integrase n=1 Tax=Altibacter sp. HG106 TaxID=3023937 RepID=UPI0023501DE7|nr:site-specific integrase [Altibacter sp. HG106]MDC7994029.1 site-specific integrase [Altibacter sp. HG106]